MGKKRSDALYNRMRNGKEDLEKYYKERERFCNKTTCSGHDIADHEEMNADINRINKETLDRINKEQSRAGLRMVTHFEGSSILPEDKRKFDEKWNAKLLEFGMLMEQKGMALKEEWEGKAQKERWEVDTKGKSLKEIRDGYFEIKTMKPKKEGGAQQESEGEGETGKFKRPKLSDIVDKAKLKCEIFKWKKLTRIAKTYVLMMTLWVIAHVGIRLFMHIFHDAKIDLIRILILWTGLGIGSVIHWACNKKIKSLMVKAYAKDKEWAGGIREELKGWDLSC